MWKREERQSSSLMRMDSNIEHAGNTCGMTAVIEGSVLALVRIFGARAPISWKSSKIHQHQIL